MSRRGHAANSELQVGIDDRLIDAFLSIRQSKPRAGQPLVQKPEPPRIAAGRGASYHLLDLSGPDSQKQAPENGEIEPFVFQGEGEMTSESRGRGVPRCHDTPTGFFPNPVMLADCRQEEARRRHGKVIDIEHGHVPGGGGPFRQRPVMKNRNRP